MKRNLVTIAVVIGIVAGLTAFNMYFQQPKQTEAQETESEETSGKLDSMQDQMAKTLAASQTLLAEEQAGASTPPPALPESIPAVYQARFETSKGPVVIEVHEEWAPLAARRFYQLVEEGFFSDARFFRVVPRFVVQFGLSGNPEVNKRWKNSDLKDEPVKQSNTEGFVSFAAAGPNTRTTQVFINTGNNTQLDNYQQGFPPFGKIVEGLDVVKSFNSKYGEQPSGAQSFISSQGNKFLDERFPGLDFIKTATIVGAPVGAKEPSKPAENAAPAAGATAAEQATAVKDVKAPEIKMPTIEKPTIESPTVVAPKVEVPTVETPKVETPTISVPEIKVPEIQAPKVDVPAVETPQVEGVATESVKPE